LQLLLSSSMDKTVRLWDLESKSCLKFFAHNDYGEIFYLSFVFSGEIRNVTHYLTGLFFFLLFVVALCVAVTCVQFNPVDEDYFISGSLDAKIRMWNIPARLVVDWTDIHEMVTAVSYTPDGQVCFSSSICIGS